MNVSKTVAIAGMFAFSAVPLAASAGPMQAFDACVKSFVEAYIPEGHAVRVRKDMDSRDPRTLFASSSGPFTIALSARGTQSGKDYGSARCIADARGHVIVMDSPPLETYISKATFTAVILR